MESLYRDHPRFNMGGRGKEIFRGGVKSQDLTRKDDKETPPIISRVLCKAMEETMGLHKISLRNKIDQMDKEREEVPCQCTILVMPPEERAVLREREENHCLHIRAITTKQIRGIIHLKSREISGEIIGIMVQHKVEIMGKQ